LALKLLFNKSDSLLKKSR